jgi:hypothetical protein
MVPSLEAFTPFPAFAFFTPFGKTSSGQIFTHSVEQGVLFAFKV